MANTTTGAFETVMSKAAQKFLNREHFFRRLANFREQNNLRKGQSVNRPIATEVFDVNDYTANTDVTAQDWSYTQQLLTVNNSKATRIDVDPTETADIQLSDFPSIFTRQISQALGNALDRDFFDEVDNAALDIDESDFDTGSSAGDPIDLSAVNAEKVWGKAAAELQGNSIGEGRLFAVIDPAMKNEITQRGIATTFNTSDKFFAKQMLNEDFQGFDIFVSNNLPSSQSFVLATVTEDATFTVASVTWTFKDALGATAGNVFTDSATLDTGGTNLAKAINGDTASTFYVPVSATNRQKMKRFGFTATYTTGTDTLLVTAYGRFNAAFSAGATAGEQTIKAMCGQMGGIDMVVQMQPRIEINKQPGNLGSTIIGHTRWGTKTFDDGAERTLKLLIKA